MPRKRHTAEQIISKLREAEVGLAGGHTVPEVCRTLGIAEQTYYRWRKEYGGLKVGQPISVYGRQTRSLRAVETARYWLKVAQRRMGFRPSWRCAK